MLKNLAGASLKVDTRLRNPQLLGFQVVGAYVRRKLHPQKLSQAKFSRQNSLGKILSAKFFLFYVYIMRRGILIDRHLISSP
jgi:hypothetical protein